MIGHAGRLAGAELIEDPYPLYARLRQKAPVWQVRGTEVFFVSTWKLVAEAVARVEDFSNHFRHALYREDDGAIGLLDLGPRGSAPDVFAGADPPAHTIHRRLFAPEFMQKKMQRLESRVTALADAFLDTFLARGRGDTTTKLANPLPMRIMAEHVIGFRDPDVGQLQHWVFAGSRLMSGRVQLGEMASIADDASGLHPWVQHQLDQALKSPGTDDVLSVTAAGVRDGLLTHDEATFTLMVFLGAGGETTTSLIGNAIRILSGHPELQDHLRANPRAVPAFLEEVLRLESPFRFHPGRRNERSNLAAYTSLSGPWSRCCGVQPTATSRCSKARTRSCSTARTPSSKLGSGGVSTTASGRPRETRIADRPPPVARTDEPLQPGRRLGAALGRQPVDAAPRTSLDRRRACVSRHQRHELVGMTPKRIGAVRWLEELQFGYRDIWLARRCGPRGVATGRPGPHTNQAHGHISELLSVST